MKIKEVIGYVVAGTGGYCLGQYLLPYVEKAFQLNPSFVETMKPVYELSSIFWPAYFLYLAIKIKESRSSREYSYA